MEKRRKTELTDISGLGLDFVVNANLLQAENDGLVKKENLKSKR